jgi:hypothetical protein
MRADGTRAIGVVLADAVAAPAEPALQPAE